MIEDLRKRLLWSDETQYFKTIDSVKQLRDDAAHLLHLVEQNRDKLENPSGIARKMHQSIF